MKYNQHFVTIHSSLYKCLQFAQLNNLDIYDANTGYISFDLTHDQALQSGALVEHLLNYAITISIDVFEYAGIYNDSFLNLQCVSWIVGLIQRDLTGDAETIIGFRFMIYKYFAYDSAVEASDELVGSIMGSCD